MSTGIKQEAEVPFSKDSMNHSNGTQSNKTKDDDHDDNADRCQIVNEKQSVPEETITKSENGDVFDNVESQGEICSPISECASCPDLGIPQGHETNDRNRNARERDIVLENDCTCVERSESGLTKKTEKIQVEKAKCGSMPLVILHKQRQSLRMIQMSQRKQLQSLLLHYNQRQ